MPYTVSSTISHLHPYDFIAWGDEVPGILALVSAAREYHRQTGKSPRSLLMYHRSSRDGIGGHLVRGLLGYLDRSHPDRVRDSCELSIFGDAPAIYKEFLRRSSTDEETGIALEPLKAEVTLRQLLKAAQIDLLSSVTLQSALKQGDRLTSIELANGEVYSAGQWIDASVNAELAQLAGVKKLPGFATLGLPEAELPVTLVFETQGLSVKRLQAIEAQYLKRFNNASDREAQHWLEVAAGGDPQLLQQFRTTLAADYRQKKTLCIGRDYMDVRSQALSIAYHAFRGTKLSLAESNVILDRANIAVLPFDRLLWNALLIRVTATRAEALAKLGAKPTTEMLQEMSFVETWLSSLHSGAVAVKPAIELYIRHAGNVTDVIDPLSGAKMLAGGVGAQEAIGSFSYGFDVRGGIAGLAERAAAQGIAFYQPHQYPFFNIGIQHALLKPVSNLAVVSPASGFTGYGCAAGRIVEFNVAVGQGVGIACALAQLSDRPVAAISNTEVRLVLEATARLPQIYGRGDAIAARQLKEFETRMAASEPQQPQNPLQSVSA